MTENKQPFLHHLRAGLRQPQSTSLIFLASVILFAGMILSGYWYYAKNHSAVPTLTVSFMHRALEHYRAGAYDAAADEYADAAAIWPINSRLVFNQGVNELERGNQQSAIAAYQRFLVIDPNDPSINHALGFSYAKSGDFESAITHLSRATSLGPSVYINLGAAYEADGQLAKAAENFMRADELAPGFPGALERYNAVMRRLR